MVRKLASVLTVCIAKRWAIPLLLSSAIIVAYFNSFWGSFQFDDYAVIVDNPSVHSFSAWLADRGIRPVLKLSYWLSWASGPGSAGFHFLNLAIHATNTLLVYLLGRRLAGFVTTHSALLAALVFGLHPVQTEAVTYISGRSTSLMALFYLASLLSYLRGKETGSVVHRYLLSPLLFALALLTKEVAVTLPVTLLLLDFFTARNNDSRRSLLARQSVHWILLAAALIGLAVHSGYANLLAVSRETRSVSANLATQASAVVYLLSQMFWPTALNIDPDLRSVAAWSAKPIGNAIFLVTLATMGLLLLRRRSWLGLGICWFFLHLAPTNSIIPRLDVVNDRQLYLAGVGLYLALSARVCQLEVWRALPRWQTQLAVGTLMLMLMGRTVMRNRDYGSEVALWESTVQSAPKKARPHHNLGCAYAFAGRYDEAMQEYQAALRLRPDYALARRNLAAIEKADAARLP